MLESSITSKHRFFKSLLPTFCKEKNLDEIKFNILFNEWLSFMEFKFHWLKLNLIFYFSKWLSFNDSQNISTCKQDKIIELNTFIFQTESQCMYVNAHINFNTKFSSEILYQHLDFMNFPVEKNKFV